MKDGPGDSLKLVELERELARTGLKYRFRDPQTEACYVTERAERARVYNWASICVLTAIFDVFLLGEMKAAPEIVGLSAWLRFALLTPAAVMFVLLDRARRLGRWSSPALMLLTIAPTFISAIESRFAITPDVLATYQATPLLQLAVLTCRMSVLQAGITNGANCLLYFFIVLTMPLMPPGMIPSLLLTDVSIFVATLLFTLQIDLRDRQVFLLGLQAEIRRDMLAAQNRTLARLSQIDALTGLGNRRCFDDTLAALWSDLRIRQTTVTLVMFDIDCFKLFNDTYGHQAGDECLATLARAVSRCIRDDRDTLVRYGGEEFAIIMAETSLQDGEAAAERVRRAVCDRAIPHPDAGPTEYVTISLGVACVCPALQSAAVLVEAADRCLYAAKRSGRNRVAVQDVDCSGVTQSPEIAARLPPALPDPPALA